MANYKNKVFIKHFGLTKKSLSLLGEDKNVIILENEYMSGNPIQYLVEKGIDNEKIDTAVSIQNVKISSDHATIITTPKFYIPKEIRTVINDDKTVYIIVQDDNEVLSNSVKSLKKYKEIKTIYSANRDEIKENEDKLSDLREERKEFRKEKNEVEIERCSTEIENLTSKNSQLRLIGSSLREQMKVGFVLNQSADISVFFRVGRPVYLNKKFGFLVFECKKQYKKQTTNIQDLETIMEVIDHSEDKKEWSVVKDKLKTYVHSNDLDLTFKLTHSVQSFEPLNSDTIEPISFKRSISMKDTIPVSKVKSAIVAQMLASGSAGKMNIETMINDEPHNLKSAIVATIKTESIVVNNEQITSTTYGWAPKLGVFNRLRKEFRILEV